MAKDFLCGGGIRNAGEITACADGEENRLWAYCLIANETGNPNFETREQKSSRIEFIISFFEDKKKKLTIQEDVIAFRQKEQIT